MEDHHHRADPHREPGARRRIPRTGLLLAAVVLLGAAPAAAQTRYAVTLRVEEQFNSNVFAGQQAALGYDFVTQVQPGAHVVVDLTNLELVLGYDFSLSLFARTLDASTGDNLVGYSNTLRTGLRRDFSPRTVLTLDNRLVQGSENTVVRGQLSDTAGYQPGIPTTGNKFVSDWLSAGVTHQLSELWTITPAAGGGFYRVFDLDNTVSRGSSVPNSYHARAGVTLARRFQNHTFGGNTELVWLGSQAVVTGEEHPLLHQFVVGLTLQWSWQAHPMLALQLGGGVAGRFAQQEQRTGTGTDRTFEAADFSAGIAPVGTAGLTFRYRHGLGARLGYSHGYRSDVVLTGSTVSENDSVFLAAFLERPAWRVQAGGSYTYMRLTSTRVDVESRSAVHTAGAQVGGAVQLVPGVMLEAAYRYDVFSPEDVSEGLLLVDYDRHMATVGILLTLPPPPVNREQTMLQLEL